MHNSDIPDCAPPESAKSLKVYIKSGIQKCRFIPMRQRSNESVFQCLSVRINFKSNLREEAGKMNLARPINLIVFFAALLFVGGIVVGAF
jgi:hypothetical protein